MDDVIVPVWSEILAIHDEAKAPVLVRFDERTQQRTATALQGDELSRWMRTFKDVLEKPYAENQVRIVCLRVDGFGEQPSACLCDRQRNSSMNSDIQSFEQQAMLVIRDHWVQILHTHHQGKAPVGIRLDLRAGIVVSACSAKLLASHAAYLCTGDNEQLAQPFDRNIVRVLYIGLNEGNVYLLSRRASDDEN